MRHAFRVGGEHQQAAGKVCGVRRALRVTGFRARGGGAFWAALLAGTVLYSAPADATSLGISVGYGAPGGEPNAYGLGLLARLGFSLPLGIYLGGTYVYHFGSTQKAGSTDVSQNVWYAGGEAGFNLTGDSWLLRPYAGIGALSLQGQSCGPLGCAGIGSEGSLYVGPGMYGQYDFGPVYLGADLRYVITTSLSDHNSLGLFGSFGINL